MPQQTPSSGVCKPAVNKADEEGDWKAGARKEQKGEGNRGGKGNPSKSKKNYDDVACIVKWSRAVRYHMLCLKVKFKQSNDKKSQQPF